MILTSFVSLKHCITTFRRCQVWFLIWYCVLLQEAKRNLFLSLFPYGSTLGTNIGKYLCIVAPYAAHFIRYIIVSLTSQDSNLYLTRMFPITPSVEINRLYSGNLKPQITVMSLIFERSRASACNRSTWKMKKMWLVAQLGLEPRRFSATDFESASYTKFRHWAL